MITILQTVLFIALTGVAGFFAFKGYRRVYKNIMLGMDADYSDNPGKRLNNMLLVALGAKEDV